MLCLTSFVIKLFCNPYSHLGIIVTYGVSSPVSTDCLFILRRHNFYLAFATRYSSKCHLAYEGIVSSRKESFLRRQSRLCTVFIERNLGKQILRCRFYHFFDNQQHNHEINLSLVTNLRHTEPEFLYLSGILISPCAVTGSTTMSVRIKFMPVFSDG